MARAYQFLDQMMDLRTTGPARRLVQSYTGGLLGQQGDTSASSYDNALLIDSYLAEGTAGGVARAKTIGDALVYLQAHDRAHDGRLRNGYTPVPLHAANDIQVTDPASSTGTLAWAGQALAQLYAATRIRAYLRSAVALGDWIQSQCRDGRGAGGYAGGDTAAGATIEWKSTEHNIDVFAFFRLLARETGYPVWSQRAAWARRFVASMWDPAQGRFYLGTTADGVTRNDAAQVEDVNSWSYLALQDPAYAASVGWDVSSLGVPAAGYRGLSYCTGDRTGVWFEGTAQVADALQLRDQPGDSGPGQVIPGGPRLRPGARAQRGRPGHHGRLPRHAVRLPGRRPVRLTAHRDDRLVHPGRRGHRPSFRDSRRPAGGPALSPVPWPQRTDQAWMRAIGITPSLIT